MLGWIIVIGLGFLAIFVFQGLGSRPESTFRHWETATSAPQAVGRAHGKDGGATRLAADQRFRSKQTLMSPAEASLFGTLRLIFGDEFVVFSKVRMADVLEPVQSGKEGKSAFNEISQKHLDYVICREGTWEIVCAVELDDSSHRRNAAVVRDTFVNIIFSGADIPLIRVTAKAGYSVQELRQTFASVLDGVPSHRNSESTRYMPTAA